MTVKKPKVVSVRRILTATPLANSHDRKLARRARGRTPSIPWRSFDRRRYSDPALALAYDTMSKLALGEYSAIELFSWIASGMCVVGAPFDLIADATCVPTDEVRHADYAIRFAAMCAGRDSIAVDFDARTHTKRWKRHPDFEDVDLALVEIAAIGETLSCGLLGACAQRARDPVAKAIFETILSDEIHHARLGWYYLAWRAPQWTRRERQRVADHAGWLVLEAEQRFSRGRDAPKGHRAAANALGVLETEGQREVVRGAMEDEIVPALDALGLGASHAWNVRPRVS